MPGTAPEGTLKKAYRLADLDIGLVKKVRRQAKSVIGKDGEHQAVRQGQWKQMLWYGLDELHTHFRSDANENQIKRLSEAQRGLIRDHCASSLERFGYL